MLHVIFNTLNTILIILISYNQLMQENQYSLYHIVLILTK